MNETLKPDLSRKRFSNISLSDECKQVILGSLLGDGCIGIHKGYVNARVQIRHSIIQDDYIKWKFYKLSEIAPSKLQYSKQPDGFSKKQKVNFMSKAMSELTEIHEIVCKKNTNTLDIKRSWLNHIDKLGLLIWWLDDGSIIGGRKQGVFCSEGFTYDDHKILEKYLRVVWKIDTKIGHFTRDDTQNKMYYRLFIKNRESLEAFFRLIMPLMTEPTMIRKMALYKHPDLQKRWISEMKTAMPTLHKEIDAFYNDLNNQTDQKDITSTVGNDVDDKLPVSAADTNKTQINSYSENDIVRVSYLLLIFSRFKKRNLLNKCMGFDPCSPSCKRWTLSVERFKRSVLQLTR